jgi:hypothetical protein
MESVMDSASKLKVIRVTFQGLASRAQEPRAISNYGDGVQKQFALPWKQEDDGVRCHESSPGRSSSFFDIAEEALAVGIAVAAAPFELADRVSRIIHLLSPRSDIVHSQCSSHF